VRDAINAWLTGLVAGALQPAVQTAGALMDPARLTATGTLYQLWADTRTVANTIFVLLVVAGGVIVLGFQTVQTRYAIKQIAPRLVMGWLAANLSWPLITTATQLGAALAVTLAGTGTNLRPADILSQLVTATVSDGPTFMVILAGVVAVLALVLTFTLIVIITVLLGLTVAAPLALCLHALPQTEAIAWWWWRAFAAALAVPTLHGLLLALLARVLLTPGGLAVGVFGLPIGPVGPVGPVGPGSLLNLLVVIAVLYLMIKIPGWALRAASGGGRRGGLLRGVLSSAVFTAGLAAMGVPVPAVAGRGAGLLGSRTGLAALGLRATAARHPSASPTSRTAARTAPGAGPGSARAARTATPPSTRGKGTPPRAASAGKRAGQPVGSDPYARVRLGPGGQLLLPLDDLAPRPGSPAGPQPAPQRPSRTPPTTGGAAPGSRGRPRTGRQLRLPLWADWPEQRPVLGRDGQYRLPIQPPRTSRRPPATSPRAANPSSSASSASSATGEHQPARPGPGQLRLPLIWATPPRRRRHQPPR
jgi:hypothetical protein